MSRLLREINVGSNFKMISADNLSLRKDLTSILACRKSCRAATFERYFDLGHVCFNTCFVDCYAVMELYPLVSSVDAAPSLYQNYPRAVIRAHIRRVPLEKRKNTITRKVSKLKQREFIHPYINLYKLEARLVRLKNRCEI